MQVAPRADNVRARSRRAVGMSEVQEGWKASGRDIAPARAAPKASAMKIDDPKIVTLREMVTAAMEELDLAIRFYEV